MSKKIIFLLLPQTNLLDFAGAAQVFLEAQEQGLQIEMGYCCGTRQQVEGIVSSVFLPLGKIQPYSDYELRKGDILFIVSANIHFLMSDAFKPEKELLSWIKQQYANGAALCAICSGAFLLGKTGLLNHRKCTTHWKYTDRLQAHFPQAQVQENILFIEDKGIFTSAGAASGIDVALHILSMLQDDFFTFKVTRELLIPHQRRGNDAQQSIYTDYRNHFHVGVHRVQDWLIENIDKKTNLEALASIANMSYRNFCRIFKKETSLTVLEFITMLRQEKARHLLQKPDLSKKQVAALCGLESERQLNRIIQQKKYLVNFYQFAFSSIQAMILTSKICKGDL